ncbi:hypothetical protein HRbin39_00644 [bacterium HR39]|nr:hypothetical protein HRbin39_00644 [bacterium HR39]
MRAKTVALPPALAGRAPALLLRGRIVRLLDVSGYDAVVLDCAAVQAAGHDYLHEPL